MQTSMSQSSSKPKNVVSGDGDSTKKDTPMSKTEAMRKLFREIKPDPVTGQLNDTDIIQYINAHPDDPIVRTLFGSSDEKREAQKRRDQQAIADFDASKLHVQHGAIWLLSLDYSGMTTDERWDDNWDTGDKETSAGKRRAEERASAPRQTFQLSCKIQEGPEVLGGGDDVRKIKDFVGLPTWKEVEDFLKICMAAPIECWTPCIPQILGLSHNLRVHEPNLVPFLSQFRLPFTWMFETDQIRDSLGEKELKRANDSFRRYMEYSEDLKEQGNKAFGAGQREEAVAKFQDAADNLDKLLLKKISEPHEKETETRRLLAICLSNCSAARMLVVDGQKDVDGAIKDAERAIRADASYPKSYNRLARAHEEQGDTFEAQRDLVRGLRVKKLENHYGLADHLILLQTQGKGLRAMGKEEFESWWHATFVDDKRMAELMEGLEGAWKSRLDDRRRELAEL